MPLGSITIFVVCAGCSSSIEATIRRDRLVVTPCEQCVSAVKERAFEDAYDMGYNAAKED